MGQRRKVKKKSRKRCSNTSQQEESFISFQVCRFCQSRFDARGISRHETVCELKMNTQRKWPNVGDDNNDCASNMNADPMNIDIMDDETTIPHADPPKAYYVPGDTDNIILRNSKECPVDFPAFLDRDGKQLKLHKHDAALVSLMMLLRKAGCPKYLYNSILAWSSDTYSRCGPGFFLDNHSKRKTFIEKFSSKGFNYPKAKFFPVPMEFTQKQGVVVPESEKSITTPVFDLISQLQRVLQDPDATKKENTILDDDDPYRPYVPNKHIQNIQDGEVFRKTVEKYRDDPDAFVVGLVCYMDKTHATGDGRYTSEPVVMVPSFLTETQMRKARRQIILGTITDMERKSSAAKHILDKGTPCRNYHAQLTKILEGLVSIQKQEGLWMKLRLHGIIKVVRLILPMIVVKGDGKSQDNLAGRYASHHPSVGRLSWCCNIKPRDSRYPWHECSYINAASTYKMCLNALGLNENREKLTEQDVDYQERDNDTFSTLTVPTCLSTSQVSQENSRDGGVNTLVSAAKTQLHDMGQYAVDLCFSKVYLGEGTNSEHGIFSASSCDVLHTLKSGIMRYIMIDFFTLMTKTERAMFDYVYNSIFRASRQTVFSYSSKLGYPGTSFSTGISNLSKVTANEWVGIMFASAALCATARGRLIFAKNMAKKWNKVVAEWKKRQAKQTSKTTNKTCQADLDQVQETSEPIADNEDDTPPDEEYERTRLDDDDSVDIDITAETVFDDDPVAYRSIWDVDEREPYIDFLHLFETLLCFNSWIRMDTFWETDPDSQEGQTTASKSLESVRILMDGIRRYAPRLDKKGKLMSNGWMIPKFHNLIHIIQQIQNFGPARLLDVESEESNHKEIVKLNAKTVQKRGKGIFESQLAENIWWMQSLEMLQEATGLEEDHVTFLQEGKSPYEIRRKKGSQNQLPTTSTSNSRGTVIVVSMTREKCLIPVPHTNVHTSGDNQDQSSDEIDKDLPSPLGMSIQVPGTTRKEQDGSNRNQTSSVHRRLTAAPHEEDVVSVNIEFHSKTNHDMTLPQFCNHFFRLHYKRFFHHIDGMSDDPTNETSTTLELFGSTELKFEDPRIGNIRAHPNYQSEGPWRDWVMAKVPKKKRKPLDEVYNQPLGEFDTILCQTICFIQIPITRTDHIQMQPSPVCQPSTSPEMTHVLLRTTYVRSTADIEKSSILFQKWRKRFDLHRIAEIVMVPLRNIVEVVGVVDENPEMIQDRDSIPTYFHSSLEKDLLQEDSRNLRNFSDNVWAIRNIKEWASEFNESARDNLEKRCNEMKERLKQSVSNSTS